MSAPEQLEDLASWHDQQAEGARNPFAEWHTTAAVAIRAAMGEMRTWFERGYMAAYAESYVAGAPIPMTDEALDKAWNRQAEIVAQLEHDAALNQKGPQDD